MNKDEFGEFVISNSQKRAHENIAKSTILKIYNYLTNLSENIHKKEPDTKDTLSVGSTGNGFSAMISFKNNNINYSFNPTKDKISVLFNGKLQYSINFTDDTAVIENTKNKFSIENIEKDLDLFKI